MSDESKTVTHYSLLITGFYDAQGMASSRVSSRKPATNTMDSLFRKSSIPFFFPISDCAPPAMNQDRPDAWPDCDRMYQ